MTQNLELAPNKSSDCDKIIIQGLKKIHLNIVPRATSRSLTISFKEITTSTMRPRSSTLRATR